jgi:hypothetical protein
MKTSLIIYEKPFKAAYTQNVYYDYISKLPEGDFNTGGIDITTPQNEYRRASGTGRTAQQVPKKVALTTAGKTVGNAYAFPLLANLNQTIDLAYQSINRPAEKGVGLNVDLYDSIAIPITYTILDVREPEKRKTSWSKTVTIPGSANNNRIFSHIYEIGQDGWVTIGNTSVYQGFNLNLQKDIVLLNDGIQVLRGNLQLKKIKKDKNGNIEYEVALSGDLTSLFYDTGSSKLDELDWTEYDHTWSRQNIKDSWGGIVKKNGVNYDSITTGTYRSIDRIYGSTMSGRLVIKTTTSHGLQLEDWVVVDLTGVNTNGWNADDVKRAIGSSRWYLSPSTTEFGYACEYQVAERISSTEVALNYFYPMSLPTSGLDMDNTSIANRIAKRTASGKGYVYPMISWGSEADTPGDGNGDTWGVTDMIPGWYVKSIWDKVMESTNSKYESNFLNSQLFKRLTLIQKKTTYDLNLGEFRSRQFNVGSTEHFWTGCSYISPGTYRGLQFTEGNTTTPQSGKTWAGALDILPTWHAGRMPFAAEVGAGATGPFYDNGITETNTIGNWDENQYKWIVGDSGEYDLKVHITIDAMLKMNGYANEASGWPFNGTTDFHPTSADYTYTPNSTSILGVFGRLKRKRGNTVTDIGSYNHWFAPNSQSRWLNGESNPNWSGFGTYQQSDWRNHVITLTPDSKYYAEGDEVWVELSYKVHGGVLGKAESGANRDAIIGFLERYNTGDPPHVGPPFVLQSIVGEYLVKVNTLSFIGNNPTRGATEGGLMEARAFLPKDMTCKDFLLGIMKMFNLHIEQDPLKDRVYRIEPRDDYYKQGTSPTDFVDWTDKMDVTSVDMRPLGELIAKYYEFSNAKESDYWNKKFIEDRGRPYMEYTKEVNNEFLKNTAKITTQFGSTVMINNPENSDVVIPAIYQQDNSSGGMKPLSNSKARILIWGGLKPFSALRGAAFGNWHLKSGSNTPEAGLITEYPVYPFAGTCDSPTDPIHDLNWYNMEDGDFVYWDSARWTNGNLYNRYWKNFIEEISDPASKVIEAFIDLDPADIFALDFKKIYILDGHWLRLQQVIDYDPIGGGLTKCEFLKLKSPTKFKLRSDVISVYGSPTRQALEEDDNTGTVTTVNIERSPGKRKPNIGYNNSSIGSELGSDSSIQLTGTSNHVSSSGRNININGDENAVGSNTRNINISGGNGNKIVGGVKNVNIIGTSKIVVNESDVTYINGVRYKNGIAISKSSVINGGMDVANVPQSESTQINIINAGEDVVITAGSQTYENVINPGFDNILPDVAELGLSTDLSPSPSTNLAGGFILSGTSSMIKVVRENARLRKG